MAGRWVYRRPYFRAPKQKIPLVRPGGAVHVARRKRHFARRRHVVHGRAAAIAALLLLFTPHDRPIVPLRRVIIRPPQRVGPRDRIILPRPFEGKDVTPLVRLLKAVRRVRIKMYQRLRWKPRPEEIPPISIPNLGKADNRGSVFSAGAVVADVYSAGSKRGSVYGDG